MRVRVFHIPILFDYAVTKYIFPPDVNKFIEILAAKSSFSDFWLSQRRFSIATRMVTRAISFELLETFSFKLQSNKMPEIGKFVGFLTFIELVSNPNDFNFLFTIITGGRNTLSTNIGQPKVEIGVTLFSYVVGAATR